MRDIFSCNTAQIRLKFA